VSLFFCLPRFVAEESTCKDTLSVEIGGIDQTQEHYDNSSAKAREFIWRHWTERRCADLFVRAISKEGVESESHDKIELLAEGKPVFVASISRSDGSSAYYKAFMIERVIPEVPYFVEKAKVIPADRVMAPSEYRLRFRDKDGKTITSF
jgi:hypothetical protein